MISLAIDILAEEKPADTPNGDDETTPDKEKKAAEDKATDAADVMKATDHQEQTRAMTRQHRLERHQAWGKRGRWKVSPNASIDEIVKFIELGGYKKKVKPMKDDTKADADADKRAHEDRRETADADTLRTYNCEELTKPKPSTRARYAGSSRCKGRRTPDRHDLLRGCATNRAAVRRD